MNILHLLFLAFVTPLMAFPYGRCYIKQCDVSPYLTILDKVVKNSFCFYFTEKNCIKESYNCCERFKQNTIKFVVSSVPKCNTSLDMVTFNTKKRKGGIYFDVYDGFAELRVTNINMNISDMLATYVCVHLKKPCNTFKKFCKGSKIHNKCAISIFDPKLHDCCPTCAIIKLS
jgi:hypothetical protein